MIERQALQISTSGRSLVELSTRVQQIVGDSSIRNGLCQVFLHHTSASLIISENADPDVLIDLENYISRIVEDGDPQFRHRMEGADDMAAHIRSVLTQSEISLPIVDGRLALGTWQGLYLWEHRYRSHRRSLTVTLIGESS